MKYYPVKRNDNFGLSLFDTDFNDFFKPFWFEDNEKAGLMKTDISEKDGNYVLEIDVPGFEKGDIGLDLDNGYLTISANRSENNDEKDKKGNYIRRERRYGSASRSFYVGDISESDIKAAYNNGILTVTVPKEEKRIPEKKHISIE
ncbi:MAG: Hsp20/alpha crystallin family protein [Clostridia bacterium]